MNKSGANNARKDLTRMLGGVANVASAMRNQARSDIQARVERIIERMDLVKRSEYEELESMLQQARIRQEELEARVASLESGNQSGSKSKTRKSGNTNAKSKKSGDGKSNAQSKSSNSPGKTASGKPSS